MKRTLWVSLLGASAFLLLSGFGACGKPTPERAKRYVDMRIDDALDDLKATADQKAKIHAQTNALYPDAVELYESHQRTKVEVTDLLAQDKVDAPKLHAMVDQRLDAVRAFAHKAVDAVINVHDIFTPQQRGELVQKAVDRQKEDGLR